MKYRSVLLPSLVQETRQYLVWDKESEEETVDEIATSLFEAADRSTPSPQRARGRSKEKSRKKAHKEGKSRKASKKPQEKKKRKKSSSSSSSKVSSTSPSPSPSPASSSSPSPVQAQYIYYILVCDDILFDHPWIKMSTQHPMAWIPHASLKFLSKTLSG